VYEKVNLKYVRPFLLLPSTRIMSDKPLDLLLVEDDEAFRTTAAQWMTRKGHRVEQAANGQEALQHFDRRQFNVAVFDMNMPGITGLELLQRIREREIDTEVLVLTGQATIENAVAAMKLGAFDYLTKPFALAELERRLQLAAEHGRLRKENTQLRELVQRQRPRTLVVGQSAAMKEVMRLIARVAPTDKTVLVLGESGTGKEVVARAIQEQSGRANQPFVTINCAALPESLVESELFGHEKGAFTGAAVRKNGLFEVADGGTLFIDEFGELPLSIQPKLLRVLEDGSLRHVGSHQERRVNVRVIAATNRDLSQEIAAGRLREDLYYRVNVMSIDLPPLRDRASDISPLIEHFLEKDWEIEPEAKTLLERYTWPGNVRQLINVLDRAMILADDRLITVDDLPRELTTSLPSSTPIPASPRMDSSTDLATIERAHVLAVLEQEHGNKARAAKALGIHRRKLYRLLERFGIGPDE